MSDDLTATTTTAHGVPADPEPAKRAFAPGQVFAERYRVVSLLGRGGMGEVYRVEDLRLGIPAAMKLLPGRMDAALERFRAEVRLSREVTHPNVCRVYDIGDAEGRHFLTMEYVDGEDLASLLRRIGRLPGEKALDIAHQLCAGIAAAHARGVLHRDLKPANVMLDGRGQVRVMDFGLAVREATGGDGTLAGTPAYMAPEQFDGHGLSARTDVYALGVMLYELFTGRRPFEGGSAAELARAHREQPPAPPSEVLPGLDPAIETVILACLEKDPAARPESVASVAAGLPGDTLALALAAGVTPSPQRVAAAGAVGGLLPSRAAALLAGAVAAAAAAMLLGRSTPSLWPEEPARPPEVLADRGRELVRALGYRDPADVAANWTLDPTALPPVRFVYRESVEPLEAVRFVDPSATLSRWMFAIPGEVTRDDPPMTRPGIVADLSASGRLLAFEGRPDLSARPEAPAGPDWTPLWAAASLSPGDLVPAAPRGLPPVPCDARQAWEGAGVRVEAASLAGVPVFFRVLPAGDASEAAPRARPTASTVTLLMLALAVAGAAALVRAHLRRGRADVAGAWRVGAATFLLMAIAFLAGTRHSLTVQQLFLLTYGFGRAAWTGVLAATFYLAVEPLVRRTWPQMLISWSRLLNGRLADPLVGSDLLIGLCAGCALNLPHIVAAALGPHLGLEPHPLTPEPESLQPARVVVAFHATVLAMQLGITLFRALALVVASRWLGGRVRATACVAILLSASLAGTSLIYTWIPGALRITAEVAVIASRGLVAGLGFATARFLLDEASCMAAAPAWAAAGRAVPLTALGLLLLHAWRTAVPRRPAGERRSL